MPPVSSGPSMRPRFRTGPARHSFAQEFPNAMPGTPQPTIAHEADAREHPWISTNDTTLSWPRDKPAGGDAVRALPELRLDHLLALTDETGLLQHALFDIP